MSHNKRDYIITKFQAECPGCGQEVWLQLTGHTRKGLGLNEDVELGDEYTCPNCGLEYTRKEIEEHNSTLSG